RAPLAPKAGLWLRRRAGPPGVFASLRPWALTPTKAHQPGPCKQKREFAKGDESFSARSRGRSGGLRVLASSSRGRGGRQKRPEASKRRPQRRRPETRKTSSCSSGGL